MSFNPNTPGRVGLEWEVTADFVQSVNSSVADGGTIDVLLESTATETITALYVFFDYGDDSPLAKLAAEGWYVAEIYDAADLGTMLPDVTQYAPSADTLHVSDVTLALPSGGDETGDLVASPRYDKINNGTSLVEGLFNGEQTEDDAWVGTFDGQPGFFSVYFAGIEGDLDSKQVLSLRVVGLADLLGTRKSTFIRPFILPAGRRFIDGDHTISGAQPAGGARFEGEWFISPLERCVWTPEMVETFDDAVGSSAAGFVTEANADPNSTSVIYSMWLEILHRPEVRKAWGCLSRPQAGWNRIPLVQPAGAGTAANWSKQAGTDYLICLRRRGGTVTGAGANVPILVGVQPNQTRGVSVDFNAIIDQPETVGALTSGGPAMVLDLSGPTVSADSQPYTSASGDVFPPLGVNDPHLGLVSGLDPDRALIPTCAQEVTAAASDDYGHVRVVVSAPNGRPDTELSCRLMSATGAVQVAGPLLFDPDDLGEDPTGYRVMEGFFPVIPTLVNGTTYRLLFESDCDYRTPWRVQVLSVPEPLALEPLYVVGVNGATFGGATLSAIFQDVAKEGSDLCVSLGVVPDAPTGFTAVATAEVDGYSAIELDWTLVPLSVGTFGQYEIDRSDDSGATWARIAEITDPSVNLAVDSESIRNSPALYRIRVRRTDGTPSLWAYSGAATATMDRCGYLFTSNHAPDLTVWYDDLRTRQYQFLDDQESTFQTFAGRDLQVHFYSLDYRGERLTPTLLVAADGGKLGTEPAAADGVTNFDPLRLLAGKLRDRTTPRDKVHVPYVCVLTQDGDRWFAAVETPNAERDEPGGIYTLDVIITEVTPPTDPEPFGAGDTASGS